MTPAEAVKNLQKNLEKAGFSPGPVDGIYGSLTKRAVMKLQQRCALKVDGIAGPRSMLALSLLQPHRRGEGERFFSQFADHFQWTEFNCPCCGILKINIKLLKKLEELRSSLEDRPVIVTSGYRCPARNRKAGGAQDSRHMHGDAADISIEGVPPAKVAELALRLGFTGVGRYPGHTHVDVRPGRQVQW